MNATTSSQQMRTRLFRIAKICGAIVLIPILACGAELPFLQSRIERDSGAYLTAGREILRGSVLYRDLWDNHTPGIHYANALALWLFGESRIAIRVCNIILFVLNTGVFFLLARRLLGGRAAYGLSLVFLFYIAGQANRDEFNAIETWMMLPMMLTALFGMRLLEKPSTRWAVLAGVATAAAVLFKQPGASAGVAAAVMTAMTNGFDGRGMQRTLRTWLDMFLGFALVIIPVLLYFAAYGALGEMWTAVVTYNRLFVKGVGLWRRLGVLGYAFVRVGSAMPLWLGSAAIALAVGRVFSRRPSGPEAVPGRRPIPGALLETLCEHRAWSLVGVWAVIDLLAACYPGFRNEHYFLQVAPSWMLLTGGLLRMLWPRRRDISGAARAAGWTAVLCGLALLVRVQIHQARQIHAHPQEGSVHLNEAVASWVAERTRPADTICVWGAEAGIYFMSQRDVASRYYFTYPLQMPDYDNARRVAEFVRDLELARPAVIIDLSVESDYALSLFDKAKKKVPHHFSWANFGAIRRCVSEHYVHLSVPEQMQVWARRDLVPEGGGSPTEPQSHPRSSAP